MTSYFITIKKIGEEVECPPTKTAIDTLFDMIENLTGLDRAVASMLMRSGQVIDHPVYSFRSNTSKGVKAL